MKTYHIKEEEKIEENYLTNRKEDKKIKGGGQIEQRKNTQKMVTYPNYFHSCMKNSPKCNWTTYSLLKGKRESNWIKKKLDPKICHTQKIYFKYKNRKQHLQNRLNTSHKTRLNSFQRTEITEYVHWTSTRNQ